MPSAPLEHARDANRETSLAMGVSMPTELASSSLMEVSTVMATKLQQAGFSAAAGAGCEPVCTGFELTGTDIQWGAGLGAGALFVHAGTFGGAGGGGARDEGALGEDALKYQIMNLCFRTFIALGRRKHRERRSSENTNRGAVCTRRSS